MEVQKVRRVVICFEYGEILLPEMPVLRLATVEGEEKRIVRVIRVEQIHGSQIEGGAARHCGKECVKQVVFLFVKLGVMRAEDLVELGASGFDLGQIGVVDDNAQREMAEVVALDFKLLDALAQLANLRFLRVVYKNVRRRSIGEIQMTHEGTLGVVEVAALRLDRLAGPTGVFLFPFGHDVEVRLDFEKAFENKREALRRWLLEREHLNVVIVEAQMPAMAFEV